MDGPGHLCRDQRRRGGPPHYHRAEWRRHRMVYVSWSWRFSEGKAKEAGDWIQRFYSYIEKKYGTIKNTMMGESSDCTDFTFSANAPRMSAMASATRIDANIESPSSA